ncbi:hypothetical protein HIM_08467 [Hirsutella minnesotensis 3608]|uniref:Peptidase M43 pregnancy-associated plasma-A domain-containing protein n=1 Tax=Hirsutella minnesotensis 3608 TaxID=1043627 RepID=A0A0F7ZYB9_9HYPO|nr:hypothetical protein HIM_08467 [Hirsutella minnesotensis 3608]
MALRFLLAGSMAQVAMAGAIPSGGRICGTQDLTAQNDSVWATQERVADNGSVIELNAAFHFCCVSNDECPSDEVAKHEIEVMNRHYDPAQIKFHLQNTTRMYDARCGQTSVTDQAYMDSLKEQTHQGGTNTLNIVYVPTNKGPGTKGYCVIPPASNNIRQIFGRKDGCVVSDSTLPGNGRGSDNDVTSVHEAGHWLGLQHWNENRGPGFSRRQMGQTRNIMDAWQITGSGIKYEFAQSQIPNLRQMAMRRKQQAGSGGREPDDGDDNQGGFPRRPGRPGQIRRPGQIGRPGQIFPPGF